MSQELRLTVLLFPEGNAWGAQVLEHDMAAHGPTPYAALAAVQLVIQAHVNFDTRQMRQPFSRLARAPQLYWDASKSAKPLELPSRSEIGTRVARPPAIIAAIVASESISAEAC